MRTLFSFCALGIALFSVAGCGGSDSDTPDLGRVETITPTTIDATVATTFPTTVGTDQNVPAFARLQIRGRGIAKDADKNPRFISIQAHETDPRFNCGPCFATGTGDDDLECHILGSLKDGFTPNSPHIVRVTNGTVDASGTGPTIKFLNYITVTD